jgi:hypothetical protein
VSLGAFDQTNLKSNKVRLFILLIIFIAVGYVLGLIIYLTQQVPKGSMAPEMLRKSVIFVVTAIMLLLFLLTLRWQVLRTAILGLSLLGLAFLYCAIVLLVFESRLAHAAGLLVLAVLFSILFLTQSNLRIYLRDKTYGDVWLEGTMAVGFIAVIVLMIAKALGMH